MTRQPGLHLSVPPRVNGSCGKVARCGKEIFSFAHADGIAERRMRKSWTRLTGVEGGHRIAPLLPMLDEITAERVLPQNLEAERSVLGAILLDSASIYLVSPLLDADDFFPDTHRRIYSAMLELSQRSAEVDVLTLKEELDRTGSIEKAGGTAYLSALLDGVPDVGNVEQYARIVKEKA